MIPLNSTITTIISDFFRVLLSPKDRGYTGGLNPLHTERSKDSKYGFFDYFEFNHELLDFFKKNKENYSFYIFTTGVVQDVLGVRETWEDIFEKIYTVRDIGFTKIDPEAYRFLAQDIGKKPSEILFVDDLPENVETAKSVGFNAIQLESYSPPLTPGVKQVE